MAVVGKKIETTDDIFGNRVREDYLTVDKTLFIYDFWEGEKTSLIVRPRRFGKTLILSLTQHFFAAETNGMPTQGLFDKFAIASVEQGAFLRQHQGQYPVIFISFKDIQASCYGDILDKIKDLIKELYSEHKHLLQSKQLDEFDHNTFKKYLQGDVNAAELQNSLKFLSTYLYRATQQQVILLIDEYDSPLTQSYEYDFLEPLSDFMRNMFSAALKTNPYLKKGLMTGILRVSKNSMLSGLNNLKIYTVLDEKYQTYFGFTESEVNELVTLTQCIHNLADIRAYYNGYKIGHTVLYNPWSLMQFFDEQHLAPYWVLTSNDKLLKELLLNSLDETKNKLALLMQGNVIEEEIDVTLRYEDLIEKPYALWTLLLFCGYLTVESKREHEDRLMCQLRIPNREVMRQYVKVFSNWLIETLGPSRYQALLYNLSVGQIKPFITELNDYLLHALSFRDVGNEHLAERFYHGFVAGLIASLRETHYLDSNKESGLGLYDFMITPKSLNNPLSLILEFKQVNHEKKKYEAAKQALAQIDALKYATVLHNYPHIKRVMKIGLAFCGKSVTCAYYNADIITHEHSAMTLLPDQEKE